MSTHSKIEWTELTWNPTTGCTKISPGCENCYAEKMAYRLKAMGVNGYENGFSLTLHPNRLKEPLNRNISTVYFVDSMSDLFHDNVPDDFIDEAISIIAAAKWHTFQLLTKRAARMEKYFRHRRVPRNLWLGVSVENRKHGYPRMDCLRNIEAPIRFISAEPLLEDLEGLNLSGISWVIVGGESGPGARPMKPEWVIHIKNHCEKQNSFFFFKQWGLWGSDGIKRSKKANGRNLFGRVWNGMPKMHNFVNTLSR